MDSSAACPRAEDTNYRPRLRAVAAGDVDAITSMALPVTTLDGTVVDIVVPQDSRDPFYDACPGWCDKAEGGHLHVETCAADRVHYGREIDVPLSLVAADIHRDRDDDLTITFPTMRMYLWRKVLYRDPQVRLGLSALGPDWMLTPAEARQVGQALIQLADEADKRCGL